MDIEKINNLTRHAINLGENIGIFFEDCWYEYKRSGIDPNILFKVTGLNEGNIYFKSLCGELEKIVSNNGFDAEHLSIENNKYMLDECEQITNARVKFLIEIHIKKLVNETTK